jgi:hypothetical protein
MLITMLIGIVQEVLGFAAGICTPNSLKQFLLQGAPPKKSTS